MRFYIDILDLIPLILNIVGRKPQSKSDSHVNIVNLKHVILVESFKYFVGDFE